MLFFGDSPSTELQAGLWKMGEKWQILWFYPQNQPHFIQVESLSLKDIEAKILQKCPLLDELDLNFVYAIPAQYVWQKTVILSQFTTFEECEQQCRFTLEKELPVPLNKIWFDFRPIPLKQGFRLDIFAIKIETVAEYFAEFLPFPVTVLDSTTNAIIRAFEYCLQQEKKDSLLIYQDNEQIIAIQQKPHELRVLQKNGKNLTALFEQFCKRYQETPTLIYFHSTITITEPLPQDWQIIECDFPFIALGNALWKRATFEPNLSNMQVPTETDMDASHVH